MYSIKAGTLLEPYVVCYASAVPYRVGHKANWKRLQSYHVQSQLEGNFELHQRSDGTSKGTRTGRGPLKFQSVHLTKNVKTTS